MYEYCLTRNKCLGKWRFVWNSKVKLNIYIDLDFIVTAKNNAIGTKTLVSLLNDFNLKSLAKTSIKMLEKSTFQPAVKTVYEQLRETL